MLLVRVKLNIKERNAEEKVGEAKRGKETTKRGKDTDGKELMHRCKKQYEGKKDQILKF
jgi:hypothetical protein